MSGPSGFNNASVTRAVLITSTLFTIVFGIQSRNRNLAAWSYQDIFKKFQIWKLIVSVFGFSSTPELFLGIYLLYYFRVFERQIGSNKYTVFVLFSITTSLLLEVLTLWLLKDPSWNILTSGPYGLIYSSFVPFFFDIPVSTRYHVLKLKVTSKTFIYLAGVQLFLSSWKRSMIPGICGIIAGFLYRLNIFRIRRVKFPEFIASFFSRLSLPSTGSTPPPSSSSSRNILGSDSSYGRHQLERNYQAPPPPPLSSMAEPPEDSIATLVSMGFDRNAARQALIRARNDINAATNILLESSH